MEQHSQRKEKPAGPADFLANERTFLAWIRTSIALMGFGFVIVKFAVFLRQASLIAGNQVVLSQNRHTTRVGIAMVALGALVAAVAYFRYTRIQKQLEQNIYSPAKWPSFTLTLALLAGSLLLILYLLPNL